MSTQEQPIRVLAPRITRRQFLQSSLALGGAAFLGACGVRPSPTVPSTKLEDELNLYNWSDYLHPDLVPEFKSNFGVAIVEDFYASNEDLLAKLQAGAPGYDVVVPTGYTVQILAKEGFLLELDRARLPNFSHMDPKFLDQPWDPGNRYSVPKDWGTTGYGYRHDVITGQPDSWADFWELATEHSGQVSVLDVNVDVVGAALKLLGFGWNSVDPGELEQAKQKLLELKPQVRTITSVYKDLIKTQQTVLSMGWNGDFLALAFEDPPVPVTYVVPREGTELWMDNWCILKNAPHPNASHAFLNYMMDPTVCAREIQYTYYAQANKDALPLIPEEFRNDPAIYPSPDTIARLEPTADRGPEGTRLLDEVWSAFLAG